jgi:hypothetical protein
MPFRFISDPVERAILTTTFEEYRSENQIDPSSQEYEDARSLLVLLFENHGHRTVVDLKAALVAAIRQEQSPAR